MDSTNIKKLQDNLIQAIEIVVDKKLESQTKIYGGLVTEILSANKYKVNINGKENTVEKIGGGVISVNSIVKVFVPQNNMSRAFIISTSGSGGGSSETVDSVNGMTGDVVLTATDVGALPSSTVIPTKTSDLVNDSNYVSDANYVHTDNNFTDADNTKLDGIETGAEKNIINSVSVNSEQLDVSSSGNVNIIIPEQTDVSWGNIDGDINNQLDLKLALDEKMEIDASQEFTVATTRTQLVSGDTLSTLFGKISKWFADLKAVAFSGSYTDLSNTPEIPSIDGLATVTYVDNGLAEKVNKVTGKGLSTNDFTDADQTKLNSLENFDDTDILADISQLQTDVLSNTTELGNKVDKVTGYGLSQENFTPAEKTKLASLENYDDTTVLADISQLQTDVGNNTADLENKVDKVTGKELSSNDFTDALLTKLNGIASGAEVNVQSNWNETTATDDSYIQNKPTTLSKFTNDMGFITKAVGDLENYYDRNYVDENLVEQVSGKGLSENDFTDALLAKLNGIATGAEVNVQADWNETVSTDDSYIQNKPTALSSFTNDQGFITSTVNNLTNYYLSSNTYTKAEVNALVDTIPQFSIEIVTALPTTDISTTTIYLVAKTGSTNDYYDEYIYVSGSWELLGSTQIDLSNYYTITQVDNLLDNKQDSLTQTQLDNISDIPNKLDNDGNASSTTSAFTTATTRANILSGETLSILFGKISKYFTDLKTVAFTGSYNDLSDTPTIPAGAEVIDNLTSTSTTASLSANQGRVLNTTKQDDLVSGTNIKTISGDSILGSGNLTIDYNDLENLPIIPSATTVVDNLTSTSATSALSANQGRVLNTTKQAILTSGTNIKTINGDSILGSGNLQIESGGEVPDNIVLFESSVSVDPTIPIDADTLGGHPSSYFATASSLSSLNSSVTENSGDISTLQSQINTKLNISGGTMTGALISQSNTNYTTGQVRNTIISTDDPTGGSNGDIWIKYTV